MQTLSRVFFPIFPKTLATRFSLARELTINKSFQVAQFSIIYSFTFCPFAFFEREFLKKMLIFKTCGIFNFLHFLHLLQGGYRKQTNGNSWEHCLCSKLSGNGNATYVQNNNNHNDRATAAAMETATTSTMALVPATMATKTIKHRLGLLKISQVLHAFFTSAIWSLCFVFNAVTT